MAELIEPTPRLYAAWREAHEEWGAGAHEDGFGLLPSDDVGLREVLIVCEATNAASARTIEHNGGVLEDLRATEFGSVRRYWITLS